MDAGIGGRLKIAGTQCVSVGDSTSAEVTVWPIGTTLQGDGIRLADGTVIKDGALMKAGGGPGDGGGEMTKADLIATGGPTIPSQCAKDSDKIWVINPTTLLVPA